MLNFQVMKAHSKQILPLLSASMLDKTIVLKYSRCKINTIDLIGLNFLHKKYYTQGSVPLR